MSDRGVFAVDRGVFNHPLFKKPRAFSRLEAWLWLLSEASWKARHVVVGERNIALKRGQCAHTVRFMGEAWGWHRAKVERFLHALETETLIETSSETGITVLTVCKYDEYQKVSLPTKTETETSPETVARQTRKQDEIQETNIGADAPAENVLEFTPPAKSYEFDGETIKATAATMERFRKDYPAIPDLVSTLRVMDAYYTHEKPLADPKKWFFHAVRWLAKENTEARERRREATRGEEWW